MTWLTKIGVMTQGSAPRRSQTVTQRPSLAFMGAEAFGALLALSNASRASWVRAGSPAICKANALSPRLYALGPVASLLRAVALTGFLDSPLWIDESPFPGSGFVGFRATTQGVYKQVR